MKVKNEVMGSNPVEALIFLRLLLSNCLNWKIYFNDHSLLSSTTAVQNMNYFIYFTSINVLSCLVINLKNTLWPTADTCKCLLNWQSLLLSVL